MRNINDSSKIYNSEHKVSNKKVRKEPNKRDNSPLVPTIARRMADYKKFDSERFRIGLGQLLFFLVEMFVK